MGWCRWFSFFCLCIYCQEQSEFCGRTNSLLRRINRATRQPLLSGFSGFAHSWHKFENVVNRDRESGQCENKKFHFSLTHTHTRTNLSLLCIAHSIYTYDDDDRLRCISKCAQISIGSSIAMDCWQKNHVSSSTHAHFHWPHWSCSLTSIVRHRLSAGIVVVAKTRRLIIGSHPPLYSTIFHMQYSSLSFHSFLRN